MAYRFIFSETAKRDIAALEAEVRKRIHKKLRRYEQQASADLKKLDDGPAEFRLRVGDYRLLLDKEGGTLYILRVHHRKDAYRR